MGQTHTQHVCFSLCPIIPLFLSCRLCLDDCNWHKDDPKCKVKADLTDNIVTTAMVQDYWANLGQVKDPSDMCGHFNGSFTRPGTCALDFSFADGTDILRLVDGVHNAGQLCAAVKGSSNGCQCIVNIKDTTARGGGSEDVKKDACAKLRSTWSDGKCDVPAFIAQK